MPIYLLPPHPPHHHLHHHHSSPASLREGTSLHILVLSYFILLLPGRSSQEWGLSDMIDCFAFFICKLESRGFFLHLFLSETCYFFPLYFCVLVLLPGPTGVEISPTSALKLIWIAAMSLCVFLTALCCGISPVLTLLTHRLFSASQRFPPNHVSITHVLRDAFLITLNLSNLKEQIYNELFYSFRPNYDLYYGERWFYMWNWVLIYWYLTMGTNDNFIFLAFRGRFQSEKIFFFSPLFCKFGAGRHSVYISTEDVVSHHSLRALKNAHYIYTHIYIYATLTYCFSIDMFIIIMLQFGNNRIQCVFGENTWGE